MTKRNGKNGHALAKPSRDPIAPRPNKVRVAPKTGVPSGPVEWVVTTTRSVASGPTVVATLLQEVVEAQTWFFARAEGARLFGVEPSKVEAVRR